MTEQDVVSPSAEIESRENLVKKLTEKAEEAKEIAAKLRAYKPTDQSAEELKQRNLLEGDVWPQINEGNAQFDYVQKGGDVDDDYIEFATDRFQAAIDLIQEYLDAQVATNAKVE